MKANSFGLKKLWWGKNGYGIREPGGVLFKILTFYEFNNRQSRIQ